jgi:hypothetical protein
MAGNAYDGMSQIFSNWMDRRVEAMEDIRALTQFTLAAALPFDLLRFGQHVMANAWLRMTEDTSACQDLTEKLLERLWGVDEFRSLAARTAAATRAAGKPLRDTATPDYSASSAD